MSTSFGGPGPSLALGLLLLCTSMVALATHALAHGELAGGEDHDDPTTAELMLTPVVVGIIIYVVLAVVIIIGVQYLYTRRKVRQLQEASRASEGPDGEG